MGQFVDITGERSGKLTAIKYIGKKRFPCGATQNLWLFQCDCGNTTVLTVGNFRSGNTKSCGCLHIEVLKNRFYPNKYDLDSYEYGVGYTDKGEPFYFDKEDYDRVKEYHWHIDNINGYVISDARIDLNSPQQRNIRLHRLVLDDWDYSHDIDHIYHKKYDNRKEMLRVCSRSHNLMNRGLQSNNTTGITGVYWDKNRNKWKAQIMVNRKTINIGRYNTKQDAINARRKAEKEYFGEYTYETKEGEVCQSTE